MSTQEIDRLTVIQKVAEKCLKQSEAMRLLKLTKRQINRLVKAYRRDGAEGLISKQRGAISNRSYTPKKKESIKEIIEKTYRDFGLKFAAEKLEKKHQIKVSKETLRQWMIEWEYWKPKRHKKVKIHQSRARRECFGELIQIDGSPHDWFEGRAPKCCLLVFIDDATSQIVGLRFEPAETTAGYFRLAREYIERNGIPLAFYSDRFGVFRVNMPDAQGDCETQFGRVCKSLDIELICANSPQAKDYREFLQRTMQTALEDQKSLLLKYQDLTKKKLKQFGEQENYGSHESNIIDKTNKINKTKTFGDFFSWAEKTDKDFHLLLITALEILSLTPERLQEMPLPDFSKTLEKISIGDDITLHVEGLGNAENVRKRKQTMGIKL